MGSLAFLGKWELRFNVRLGMGEHHSMAMC